MVRYCLEFSLLATLATPQDAPAFCRRRYRETIQHRVGDDPSFLHRTVEKAAKRLKNHLTRRQQSV